MTVANHLVTRNQPWLRAAFEVLGMVSLAIAAFILYPILGPKGMALALAVSEWGMVGFGLIFLTKKNY